MAGNGKRPEEVLRDVVGPRLVDLACEPTLSVACAGRLLASLEPATARRALDELEGVGAEVGPIRTFLNLVHKGVASPTPELRRAVELVTFIMDTPAPETALVGVLKTNGLEVSKLVSAHLRRLHATEEERAVVWNNEIPFALAVASATVRPLPLSDDVVAIKVFDDVVRPTTQLTVLRLAANMFWPFVPYADLLLDKVTTAVSDELASAAGAVVSFDAGTLHRVGTASTTASKVVGLRTPLDIPVDIMLDLVTVKKPPVLARYSMNSLDATASVFISLDKVPTCFGSGPLHYDLFTEDNMRGLGGTRRLSDVAAWYAHGIAKVINSLRGELAHLLSEAVTWLAAAGRGYDSTGGMASKSIGSGATIYCNCWYQGPLGTTTPAVGIAWQLSVAGGRAFGRAGVERLVQSFLGGDVKGAGTYYARARGLEQALRRRFEGVDTVLVRKEKALSVTIRMKPTVIAASDFVELQEKVGKYLSKVELEARLMVDFLKGLAANPAGSPEEPRGRNRPGGPSEEDAVPA